MGKDYKKRLDELGDIGLNGRCISVCREILSIAREILKERDDLHSILVETKEHHDCSVTSLYSPCPLCDVEKSLLKEKPCEGCGEKVDVCFKVCSGCFHSGGY